MATRQKKVDVTPAVSKAAAEDAALRDPLLRAHSRKGFLNEMLNPVPGDSLGAASVADSLVNFAAKIGIGTDNLSSAATYGFNPITRQRTILEWIHRGSWLGGVAIDVKGDDMVRAGVEIKSQMDVADIERIEEWLTAYDVWGNVGRVCKWADLYGGALGLMLVDGQRLNTPLRMETVGKDQFKGILPLDRWQVEPLLNDLVTDWGPDLGKPKFYRTSIDGPAIRNQVIHYSRIFRLDGIELPYQQRLQENLWGISVFERMYDRMVAFDSATQGAAQLVYKAYQRVFKIKDYRETIAGSGVGMENLIKSINMMARFQSIEGIILCDAEDEYGTETHAAFGGLADALDKFGEQIAGALQIPLVRLFGQSPNGMSATGESDLKTYYDGILQRQNRYLKVPVTRVYRMVAQSLGIKIDDTFAVKFKPLWQLTEEQRAGITSTLTSALVSTFEAGILPRATVLREMRAAADETGTYASITDEDITEAEAEGPPEPTEVVAAAAKAGLEEPEEDLKPVKAVKAQDAANAAAPAPMMYKSVAGLKFFHDLEAVVETPAGVPRPHSNGTSTMLADYGYLRGGYTGADGDPLDCWIGAYPESRVVFVLDVSKLEDWQQFDEHKVMLGYYTEDDAREDFRAGYSPAAPAARATRMTMEEFKAWLAKGDFTRPVSSPSVQTSALDRVKDYLTTLRPKGRRF